MVESPTVLVVDDETQIREVLEEALADEGYGVALAADARDAEARVAEGTPDLILLDIWMPGTDGMDLLREWVDGGRLPCPVVMMSGHSTIESAVEATRLGAYDYLEKPLSLDKLLLTVSHAVEAETLRRENRRLREGRGPGPELVGSGAAMTRLQEPVARLAATAGPVLIQGEPGAGKEAVARSLHQESGRLGPFVGVSSVAIAPRGMEEQLFGTEDHTGPATGRFEEADGGVLFLDEVADLQPEVQARLVRVVQEQRFTRVGGRQPVHVDVRVIAATNQELAALVQEGSFRSDLYYRLNVFPLRVPPLREHPEDIPELVEHFLVRHIQRQGLPPRTFSQAALEALRGYDWPGNVRELENVVERILILSEADPVGPDEVATALGGGGAPSVSSELFQEPLRQARESFEREYLAHRLREARGNMTRASELAGLERTHLYRKVRQLGLDPADYKEGSHGE